MLSPDSRGTPRPTARDVEEKDRSRACARCVPRFRRQYLYLPPALLALLLLYRASSHIISIFHWAERHVDRESPWHMVLSFAVTLPFHLGLPIPIVHQVWAVAIGCFFRWRAFPILVASLSVGVPLPFLIGRRLAASVAAGDPAAAEAMLRRWSPRGVTYLAPLRRAIAARPVRSCFLLMWAPLPTSTLPLLVGFLIPPRELRFSAFVLGALPSKLLHFACDVLIGLEAGSLAIALDAHDDLPGVNDLPSSKRWARGIALGAMLLTVAFVALMIYAMHQALRDMKAKEAAEAAEDLEGGNAHLSSSPMFVNGGGYRSAQRTPLLRATSGDDADADAAFLPLPESPGGGTWHITPARLDNARAWDAREHCACGARSPHSPTGSSELQPPSPRARGTPVVSYPSSPM